MWLAGLAFYSSELNLRKPMALNVFARGPIYTKQFLISYTQIWYQQWMDGSIGGYAFINNKKNINMYIISIHKKMERYPAYTIVSWPNPKQWVIVHTSDLMMIIRQSIYTFSIITRGMGKLKTHSPTYCIMDNWVNMFNLTYTLDKLYLTGIL